MRDPKLIPIPDCNELARAISIARVAGVQWTLPMAFYFLSQYSVKSVFNDNAYSYLSKEQLRAWTSGRDARGDTMASLGLLGLSISSWCTDATHDDPIWKKIKHS